MGIRDDNWPATVGVFTGILAKETVVGTLNTLYSSMAVDSETGKEAEGKTFDFWAGMNRAFATIGTKLEEGLGKATDPLGLDIGDVSSSEAAAEKQGVKTPVFGAMAARFDGPAGAFAYLLMVLLYMPCVAAIAAVYRETNTGWTIFVSLWTTLVGYTAAVLFYQTATFARHPASSTWWIAGIAAVLIAVVWTMWYVGKRDKTEKAVIVPGV